MSAPLEKPVVIRQLTVRRASNGDLDVYVGDELIDGVVAVTTTSNPEQNSVYIQLHTSCVHFDTEQRADLGKLN